MEPFSIPGRLVANPHLYDYIHMLEFQPQGLVEMVDGAGQMVSTQVRGNCVVYLINASSAEIAFYDMVRVNPYHEDQELNSVEPFRRRVTREEGLFPFRQEVVWRIRDQNEWPCLLYRVRYIFDTDPLDFSRSWRANNLYYLSGDGEHIGNEQYYYAIDDRQELTAKELLEMGISQQLFW